MLLLRSISNKLALSVALALLAVSCSACATAQHQLYSGPPRPRDKIAVFWGGGGMGLSQAVRLWSVDGKDGPTEVGYGDTSNGAFRIELEPGFHTLRAGYLNLSSAPGALMVVTRGDDQTLTLDAKPGGSYKLQLTGSGEPYELSVVEEAE